MQTPLEVFLALDKSPLLFRPVSLRGVLARPDEIAEQIATNYAVDALLRSLAVVGSLEALGSPTTLLSEWGKGVYDLFAIPIRAMPQVLIAFGGQLCLLPKMLSTFGFAVIYRDR